MLERRLVAAQRKGECFVQAIADGGSEFVEIRSALTTAKSEATAIEAELAELATAPVIAFHPGIADDYRRRAANLRELLSGGEDGSRRDADHQVCVFAERIKVSPNSDERGVDRIRGTAEVPR